MHAVRFLRLLLVRTLSPVLVMACMPVLIPAFFLYRVCHLLAHSVRELWNESR